MNVSGQKRLQGPAYGDAPSEKVRTLGDEQLKKLLDKQLNTKTTLEAELKRKRNITASVVDIDNSSEKSGIKSLGEFQAINEEGRNIVSLREHGLTDDQIQLKTNVAKYGEKYSSVQLKCADSIAESLHIIEEKITKHQYELSRPDQFSDSIKVNRRELEINNASHHGTQRGGKFSYLLKLKEKNYPVNDPVCATLREYEESLKSEKINENVDRKSCDDRFIGPVLCSINERVELIPEEVVFRNRLTLSEIKKIDRFKDYKAGEVNNVLYIKNLAKGTTEKDLAKLFARFYVKDTCDVQYKIMHGRMRGQAFVTFDDARTASEALLLINGYVLNNKPLIISYRKEKVTEE